MYAPVPGNLTHDPMEPFDPEKTDRVVRTVLARTGGKKGDLSRFVDDAARRRVLDLTVRQIKDRNNGYDRREILDLIDDEVDAARAGGS